MRFALYFFGGSQTPPDAEIVFFRFLVFFRVSFRVRFISKVVSISPRGDREARGLASVRQLAAPRLTGNAVFARFILFYFFFLRNLFESVIRSREFDLINVVADPLAP